MGPKKTLFMVRPRPPVSQEVLRGLLPYVPAAHDVLLPCHMGNSPTAFMGGAQDEISTGLDSSTTHQITQILANFCHIRDATILLALLQPAPEVPRVLMCSNSDELSACCQQGLGICL